MINSTLVSSALSLRTFNPFCRSLNNLCSQTPLTTGQTFDHIRTGRRILKLFRKNATEEFLKSGQGTTFPEFIRFILHLHRINETMDEHWRPQYDLSLPCIIPYQFIGKFETLWPDLEYVLDNIYHVNSTQLGPVLDKKPTTANIANHFDQIPSHQKATLREIYKLDFEMFGYDPYSYQWFPFVQLFTLVRQPFLLLSFLRCWHHVWATRRR